MPPNILVTTVFLTAHLQVKKVVLLKNILSEAVYEFHKLLTHALIPLSALQGKAFVGLIAS